MTTKIAILNTTMDLLRELAPRIQEVQIDSDTRLVDDLRFTSMEMIELVAALESAFNINFTSDAFDLDSFSTPGAIVSLVERAIPQ